MPGAAATWRRGRGNVYGRNQKEAKMPTKGGLDEFNRKMEALRLLLSNYNKAIEFISVLTAPCERYAPTINDILESDKKIKEGLNGIV
jgi:hypothetical protein